MALPSFDMEQGTSETTVDNNDLILDWLKRKPQQEYAIANRLKFLNDESIADHEDDVMSNESLYTLLRFLNRRPSLTLNGSGEISAVYHFYGYQLIIRFLKEGGTEAILLEYDILDSR